MFFTVFVPNGLRATLYARAASADRLSTIFEVFVHVHVRWQIINTNRSDTRRRRSVVFTATQYYTRLRITISRHPYNIHGVPIAFFVVGTLPHANTRHTGKKSHEQLCTFKAQSRKK